MKRLLGLGLLLTVISMITFAAMNLLGDPLFNILGPVAEDVDNPDSVKLIEEAKEQYYLDKSLPERYVRWAGDFVTGDFGVRFSATGQPPVTDLIKERFPRTLQLMLMAQLIAVGLAIPWAVNAASRANSKTDKASTVTAFAFVSLPNFALAIILFYVFSIRLDWTPDVYTATDPFWGFTHDHKLMQMLLPALTLGMGSAAGYQRLLRTDLITTLQQDFILMARSKGVSRRKVLYKHALRPSLFSLITLAAINIGYLIGGALVVETFFRIPGLGTAVVEAVLREDFPVVLAIVMIVATAFLVFNYLADLLYGVIDPRVREKENYKESIFCSWKRRLEPVDATVEAPT
ncbi:MAG TPA: ABC transporter permease [Acidimicrobiales bacterium]|nr:ABC transporter permease [Acidimicrobiales bacterium]